MKFFVNLRPAYQGEPTFVLHTDNWNDWYKWYTLFSVQAVMPNGEHVDLGAVKIARHGMTEQDGRTQLPQMFEALDKSFFSLGQSENYYETLMSLGDEYASRSCRPCGTVRSPRKSSTRR